MSKSVAQATQIEPSFQPFEAYENAGDRERREYAEVGGDWAYFLVKFLQGTRRLEISSEEIVETQLYLRSNDVEKRALLFVCDSRNEIKPSSDDKFRLQILDQFLLDYVESKTLGHLDWVDQIKSIPARVAERQRFDRQLFPKTFPSPKLFSWVFGERR